MSTTRTDISALQAYLQAHTGNALGSNYWRSLEELAGTDQFREFLYREFPRQASEWTTSMDRRHFLKLMGASLALAGLTGCTGRSSETIVPQVRSPEEALPGKPLFYATAMQVGGYSMGLLAQSHEFRPTKIEGNPDHPASMGATDAFAQASILALYDPDRPQHVRQDGVDSSWDEFGAALQARVAALAEAGGAGLRILTETVTSPTLHHQLHRVLETFPNARWHQYEPVNRDSVYDGARLAFGRAVEPVYRFDRAELILSLDADFMLIAPGRVRFARDFAAGRRVGGAEASGGVSIRNRLYVIESTPTVTGSTADHRLAMRASHVELFVRALAQELGLDVAHDSAASEGEVPPEWVAAVAEDLRAHEGTGLVVAGDGQPPLVHALVYAINEELGNVYETVYYTNPVVANPENQSESLRSLVDDMSAGEVEMLLILGANPAYYVPAGVDFAQALEQVDFRTHLGLYADETSVLCQWQLPESHYLEAWGDGRAYDGTVCIQQPLIEPLYDSRPAIAVLSLLLATDAEAEVPSDYDLVRTYWMDQRGEEGFDSFWNTALHDGIVANSALSPQFVSVQADVGREPMVRPTTTGIEIVFRPDPTIYDGRFANNGWLQELPKPLTKLTWENAALLNPLTGETFGLAHGDVVELAYQGQTVEAPVWLMPGHSEESVTVYLGYGRTYAGRVGTGAGFNAYALRSQDTPWFGAGATLQKVGSGHRFASTQNHHAMDGRNLVRTGTVDQFESDPEFVQKVGPEGGAHHEEISLYPDYEYEDNSWGMVIDLNACNGCNACVTACQAENNIPIVGAAEVTTGREMHWLRVDHYYQGDLVNPEVINQPVMCMHCENAPCEVVCPVGATIHDHEGLNTMVYNRCIGTRYCSNNCPYKVRRFNFLQYSDLEEESLKLQRNPNVTVRARGVMEKCTYCIQRISAARIAAKVEGRPIVDGEVVTACQGACPTQAIVFGNLNDPESQVAQRKRSPLNYGLLTELNTQPRTTYLAKLRNPNPELEGVNG